MVAPLLIAAAGLNLGAGIFSGISQYQQAKESAKQRIAQAQLDSQKVLDEAHDTMQEQKMIASGGGYILEEGTSPLEVMLDTEQRANEYAKQIMDVGKKEAKSMKKAGRNGIIGGALSGIGGMVKGFF